MAREQASIPIPYSEPEPYNENKPINLAETTQKIISSIPVINNWFPQPQKRSGSMVDLPYQRSGNSLSEPLMQPQQSLQRSVSLAEPSVRFSSSLMTDASSSQEKSDLNATRSISLDNVRAASNSRSNETFNSSSSNSGSNSVASSLSPSGASDEPTKPEKGDSKLAARLEELRKKL